GLELLKVLLIHAFLVAELDIPQGIGFGMSSGRPLAPPSTPRGSFGVFDKIRHVLGSLVQVEGRDGFKPCSLAEIHEVRDAPPVGGIRIPRASIGRAAVAGPIIFFQRYSG